MNVDHSENIAELTQALSAAQGAFPAVQKSGKNAHLGNEYSTLDDIIAAVRKPLADNGLAFVQPLTTNEAGAFILETVLMHSSGEWLSSTTNVPSLSGNRGTNELQVVGGALTYMRRYMLSALLGVTSEEDVDGNAPKQEKQPRPAKAPAPPPDNGSGQHWIEDKVTAAKFWKWSRETMGLTDDEVHQALNKASVKDFPGTKEQAAALIKAWVESAAKEPANE